MLSFLSVAIDRIRIERPGLAHRLREGERHLGEKIEESRVAEHASACAVHGPAVTDRVEDSDGPNRIDRLLPTPVGEHGLQQVVRVVARAARVEARTVAIALPELRLERRVELVGLGVLVV